MFYMGEHRKLWKDHVPADLEVYEMALELNKTPDEIRAMPADDFRWMQMIPKAKRLALAEMAERPARKPDSNE